MLNSSTKKLARAGIIAGLYLLLSLLTFSLSSGVIQFRIAEGLTLLPILYLESAPALFVGCLICNLITGCSLLDVVAGSVITLIAGILTRLTTLKVKGNFLKIFIGGLFPTILNAIFLPLIWLVYGVGEYVYYIQVLSLTLSQGLSVYLIGSIIYLAVKNLKDRGISFLK